MVKDPFGNIGGKEGKLFHRVTTHYFVITDIEVDQFRKSNLMIINGDNIPKPFDIFDHSGLPGIIHRKF